MPDETLWPLEHHTAAKHEILRRYALRNVAGSLSSTAEWAVSNPASALGIVAGATCIVTTGGACTALVYTAAAANLTVSGMRNVVQPLSRGESANLRGFAKDVAVTGIATGCGVAVTGP